MCVVRLNDNINPTRNNKMQKKERKQHPLHYLSERPSDTVTGSLGDRLEI